MKENFLFHIDHTCCCLFLKLHNKIQKIGVPERGFFIPFSNSLCPHFAKTAVYSCKSLLLPSTFFLFFHVKRISEMDHKCG